MTTTELSQKESEDLRKKELADAKKKADSRGVPYYLYRGWVYAIDKSVAPRRASEVEQIFWDALAVMG